MELLLFYLFSLEVVDNYIIPENVGHDLYDLAVRLMKPIPYKMHHPLVLKVRQIQIPYDYLLDNKDNAYPKRRRGGKNLNNILEHLL